MIAWIWRAVALHWNTELVAKNHVPLECTGGVVQEVDYQSHPPHPPST
jgi:hypothetical protein